MVKYKAWVTSRSSSASGTLGTSGHGGGRGQEGGQEVSGEVLVPACWFGDPEPVGTVFPFDPDADLPSATPFSGVVLELAPTPFPFVLFVVS